MTKVTATTPTEMGVWKKKKEKDLSDAYEKIVHWNRNLFMMLSGPTGKKYIEEITRLLKLGIQDSSLKSIALKTTRHASIVASET